MEIPRDQDGLGEKGTWSDSLPGHVARGGWTSVGTLSWTSLSMLMVLYQGRGLRLVPSVKVLSQLIQNLQSRLTGC